MQHFFILNAFLNRTSKLASNERFMPIFGMHLTEYNWTTVKSVTIIAQKRN